jgi:GT2 family glycosyltransferase
MPASVQWEVVVVDNNSKDRTREVVEDFCRRFPGRFSYLFEPRQGKSNALNAGIRQARGDVLAFMDDDVIADPVWLRNLTSPFEDPGCAGTGGRILLERSFSPPPWLGCEDPYNVATALAQFDLGDKPFELETAPYGTCMAFRKEMFQKYGGFRTDIGPCPGSEIRGEDVEFGSRLLTAGERILYEPSAVVYHAVPEARARKSYLLTWYFDHGREMVRIWGRGPSFLGMSRRTFTAIKLILARLPVQTLAWALSANPKRRFYRKCWLWVTAGQISEICRQRGNTGLATGHE